jgi:hypothetical protein
VFFRVNDPATALASGLVRHRNRWTFVTLLVLVAALALASRLKLRSDLQAFLPRGQTQDDPTGAGLDGDLAQRDRMLVVLESDGPISSAEVAPVMDALAARLAVVPGVRRVEHRLRPELRRFAEREGPARALLYFTTPQLAALGNRLSREGLERILLRKGAPGSLFESIGRAGFMRQDPLGVVTPALGALGSATGGIHLLKTDGYFAAPNLHAFFLVIEPARPIVGIDDARSLVRGIEDILEDVRRDPAYRARLAGKRLSAIGRPVGYVRGHAMARADAKRIVLATTVALFLLLLAFYRRPLGPLIILGTILFGMALAGAVASLALGSVSLVAWIFVSVLGGLGVDCTLHVVTHYWTLADPTLTPTGALASALARPGRGIIFGGLTNAATFFSLVVVSYPVIVELGWLAALGMVVILVASFTVLPLLLSYTSPGRAGGWSRWTRMAELPRRQHRLAWLLGWGALVAGSLWVARSLPFEPHPWRVVLEGNPATEELEHVRRLLGTSFTPVLMVATGATAEEALERDREAVAALERVRAMAGVAVIQSLSHWLPAPERQRANRAYLAEHGDLFSAERVRRDLLDVVSRMDDPDPTLVRDYLPLVGRVLNPPPDELTVENLRQAGLDELIRHHLMAHDGEHRAVSYVFLREMPWTAGAVERFTTAIDRFGGPALARVRFAGDALHGGVSHTRLLRRDLAFACGFAALLVGAVLWLEFRRARLVLLCLAPLVCCLSSALGLMALLHIELNVLTLAIAPLLVGLGVDNGIHVVERLRRGEPLPRILAETGPAMTMTTLSNVAAFACLGLATFPGVRQVGLVGVVGLLVGLAASVQLVPLLYGMVESTEAERPDATHGSDG